MEPFAVTPFDGQKNRFAVPDFDDMRLQVLEHDDNQLWQELEGCFAQCEASTIEDLDELSASGSHPGTGAASDDPDEQPPTEL